MKKKLAVLAIASLFAAANAQDMGLSDTRNDIVRDSYGDCIVTLDGVDGCYAKVHVQNISLDADAFFDFDKSTIKPEGRAVLDKFISDLNKVQQVDSISLAGHTDSVGSLDYNQRLSERRARAVEEYLVGQGVSPSIMESRGYGEVQPIVPNDTPENRAKNRRVDVVITGGKFISQ